MAPRIPAIRPEIYDFSDAGSFGGAFYVFGHGYPSREDAALYRARRERRGARHRGEAAGRTRSKTAGTVDNVLKQTLRAANRTGSPV